MNRSLMTMASGDPSFCSEATLQALEFPAVVAMLSELAATDLGQNRIRSLHPFTDAESLRQRRRCFEESIVALQEGVLVPSLEKPLESLLVVLGDRSGSLELSGQDFLQLAELLTASERAAHLFRSSPSRFPTLAQHSQPLAGVDVLLSQIRQIFDPRGEVRDNASPQLKVLRERSRRQRAHLYRDLGSYAQHHREQLADDTLSMREGRLSVLLPAGARGRLQGLFHGRSATGKSFYFEPLEFVEANNELQQALEDEDIELRRILHALVDEVRRHLPAVERHAEFLGFLDLLQASCRLSERWGGRLVELTQGPGLRLLEARHPLLDPRLGDLRHVALDSSRDHGAVVPLNLELSHDRRALVVTGPNAGGKTVALKTLGLFVVMVQCGLPVAAAPGTELPLLTRLMALVGDEQDLLAGRSTFSARLLRLKEAWEVAGPGSLVLIDELGSGTNPEEGTALSVALLEELVERQGMALITTHLTELAAAAMELAGASCAAMEFDPDTLQPTFRLLPGPPGGSEALALAQRLALPRPWIERAEARLGHQHRDLRRLLAEVEKIRGELLTEQRKVEREHQEVVRLRTSLHTEKEALEAEREAVGQRSRQELESFRRTVYDRLKKEVELLAREFQGGRRRRLPEEAVGRLFADAPVPPVKIGEAKGDVEVGQTVRHTQLGWSGQLVGLRRGRAEVQVQGKTFRCHQQDLIQVDAPQAASEPRSRSFLESPGANDRFDAVSGEVNLIGQRVESALEVLDTYLDRALAAGLPQVRVVHGHGSGRLRSAVRNFLKTHPGVSQHTPAPRNQGGDGATVVILAGA